jgi:hypothetical protein
MRWMRLHSVDARSLLCDSRQIPTASNDLTRTYCSPMMVNLKCAFKYDRIGEHGTVVGEVFVRGGYKGLCRKSLLCLMTYIRHAGCNATYNSAAPYTCAGNLVIDWLATL